MDLITLSVYGRKASTAAAAEQTANRRHARLQRAQTLATKRHEEKLASDLAYAKSLR